MQILPDEQSGRRSFPHCGRNTLSRAVPYIACSEDTRHTRFQQEGLALEVPGGGGARQEIPSRENEAPVVTSDIRSQPLASGLGPNKYEQGSSSNLLTHTPSGVMKDQSSELLITQDAGDLGVRTHRHIRTRVDVAYESAVTSGAGLWMCMGDS